MIIRTCAWAFTALLLLGAAAHAQLAATVPASDPVYEVVDELAASLPVRALIAAQRPWSRREVARLTIEFQAERDRRMHDTTLAHPAARISDLVDSLAAAYGDEIRHLSGEGDVQLLQGALVKQLRVDAIGTNSAYRPVPSTNGLGSIHAITNPLTEPNWGRPVADGLTGNAEILSLFGFGSHVALGIQPRFTWLRSRQGAWSRQFDFQRLYARAVLANIAVEAGMDEFTWGQGGERGLLLSGTPRPLHAITIGNDSGVTLPWLFRLVGPVSARLQFANLGNSQNHPGAQLVTYGFAITPTPRLELGAALLDQMGGGGSPPCSVKCRLEDLFPYVFWAVKQGSDSQATNKIAQIEARYRIPQAKGLALYYELSMDDFDLRRVRSMLWQDSGHLLGATFERLDTDGHWGVDLQAHHTSLRLYEHPQFTSGVTYRESIIGDPLGTNGYAGYGTLRYRPSILRTFEITGAYESRDPSMYTIHVAGPQDNGWQFIETQPRPIEVRTRVGVALRDALLGTGISIEPSAAIERVHNDSFVAGSTRVNFLVGITGRLVY